MSETWPLDAGLGVSAGAIEPAEVEPVNGAVVLVLGDEAGGDELLADGDYTETFQRVTVPAPVRLLRPSVALACFPVPADASFSFSVMRGDPTPRTTRALWDKRILRTLSDVAIPVAAGGEGFDLGFRLSFALDGGGETEARVPAAYVDAVADDETLDPLVICNRDPEPGEVGVPRDALIRVEFVDTFGAGTPLDAMVTIGGVVAFTGGVFQAGFAGPDSTAIVLDGGATLAVIVDVEADFASEEVVDVVASARAVGELNAVSWAHSFVVEDYTAPRVVRAYQASHALLWVDFDEAMLADASEAGVLRPDNWTIELASSSVDDGLPAFSPITVVSARMVSPQIVELALSDETTAGAIYRVSVALTVEDTSTNAIDPDYVSATFTGYACTPRRKRTFSLRSLLPQHNWERDAQRDLEVLVRVYQHVYDRILCDIDTFSELADPNLMPERFLTLMLADLGCSEYGGRRAPFGAFVAGLDRKQKRDLIYALADIYRSKGTDGGIVRAVKLFLGVDIEVHSVGRDGIWILNESKLNVDTKLGSADPYWLYSFYISAAQVLTEFEVRWITLIAEYAKAAHTHFLGIRSPVITTPPEYWLLNVSKLGVDTVLAPP